jgi:hypothetical protein
VQSRLAVRVENAVVSGRANGRATLDRFTIEKVDPRFPNSGGNGLQAQWP